MRSARIVTVLLAGALVWSCTAPEPDPDAPAGSEEPSGPMRVWIDTDPSVLPGGNEVDDGLALVQAFHSPELEVVGVGAVFGNAPLATTFPNAREIVQRFGPDGVRVWSGADGSERLGEPTGASRALTAALEVSPLYILALGPVTNVATVLQLRPDLRTRIREIVAVAGRRPGDEFRVGAGRGPLRDLNFELDPQAFQVLLESGVLFTLAPFEISSKVTLTAEHAAALEAGGAAGRWLAPAVRDWLELWEREFEADGFHPFDTLAVAYLTSPDLLTCHDRPSGIVTLPDDIEPGREKPYLHVAEDVRTSLIVRYCYDVDPAFTDQLITRLTQ